MLHYDGKLYIGGKLGDIACFTVLSHYIKHVKIIFQFLDVGKMKQLRLTVVLRVSVFQYQRVTAYGHLFSQPTKLSLSLLRPQTS